MKKKAFTLLLIAGFAVAGCSESDPAQEYFDGVRAAFPDADDATVSEIAEGICDVVEAAIESGMTNEEAADRAYSFSIREGIPDGDAFFMVTSAIGGWCPMDIRD